MLVKELLFEGGNAFPNAGSIHKTEIPATLRSLSKQTGLKDLENSVLGSTGKKLFSGDIDISVGMDPMELMSLLRSKFGTESVTKHGNVIHLLFPITGYDANKDIDQAREQNRVRTGYVQIDFMPGDRDWNRAYFYSSEFSKIPGKYRNLLLANIAIALRNTTHKGDYVETFGYVFSPKDGLSLRKRTQKKGQTKKTDEVLYSTKNMDEIAKKLLGDAASAKDLENVESLVSAVSKYLPEKADVIFSNFVSEIDPMHLDLEWPEDIKKFLGK